MSASHDIEETEAIHLGIAIKEECDLWRADLEMADHEGGFFASLGIGAGDRAENRLAARQL